MRVCKSLILVGTIIAGTQAWGASTMSYFSCTVKEKIEKKNVTVTVKFAVKNLDALRDKGELVQYPGTSEDSGMISVTPTESGDRFTMMSNLNSQGGDLRVGGDDIRLFGDGDGYQFTDLVMWDVSSAEVGDTLEGYVRDYGPAYGDDESFKQFIKCKRNSKP